MALAFLLVAIGTGSAFLLAGCDDGDGAKEVSTIVTTAGTTPTPHTITVTGRATVQSAPDEATVTLAVETDGADPGSALNANSESTRKVLERLKAEGVEESAIRTANVSVIPLRTYDPQTGKESLSGYRAQNSVSVTLKDAALVGKILAASVETGATNVSGPVWRLTEESAAVTEALKKAVANAQTKAQTLAAAGGMKVGKVVAMSEGSVDMPVVPMYADMYVEARAAGKVEDAPISPGVLDVTAIVSITYDLAE